MLQTYDLLCVIFIKEKFDNSPFLNEHPYDKEYRLQHSYRVANIGKMIAEAEGFDVEETVVACLLHDVSYCLTFDDEENSWQNHGRNSAHMVRNFLESLGMARDRINEICYGIAIHVDDVADFDWERTPFAETVVMRIILIDLMCIVFMRPCSIVNLVR